MRAETANQYGRSLNFIIIIIIIVVGGGMHDPPVREHSCFVYTKVQMFEVVSDSSLPGLTTVTLG